MAIAMRRVMHRSARRRLHAIILVVAVTSLAACGAPGDGTPRADGSHSDLPVSVDADPAAGEPAEGAQGEDAGAGTTLPTGDGASPTSRDAGGDAPVPAGGFRHPGVLVNGDQLAFVKAQVAAKAEPWTGAFTAASASRYGSLAYAPAPIANVVCGSFSNPDIGCSAEKSDATAAYTHALLWALTGKQAHADKAIQILNGWSAVLTQHTNSNAPLQAAWVGSVFPRAAEILKHTGAGWAAADADRFAAMLRKVYLPAVIGGAARENGNWELSMIEASIAMAVFLDDQPTFDRAVAMWRARVPAYVYLSTDGPVPVLPPGKAVAASQLGAFWLKPTAFIDGLAQETCRDLGHVQYGLAAMINAAETARIQGVDLYAEQATRITRGLELHARYLDRSAGAASPCAGALSAVSPDPMWEIAVNAYEGRLGRLLPAAHRIAVEVRPSGADHHMDWETLTHAGVGNVGIP
jgi:hypothetical protein